MKRIITLLLALLLLVSLSASAVMAEEPAQEGLPAAEEPAFNEDYPLTEDVMPVYEEKRTRPIFLPVLPFGTDLNESAIKLKSEFENSGSIAMTVDPQLNTITLSNGNPYQMISISGKTISEVTGQLEIQIFGTDAGSTIGAVYVMSTDQKDFLSYYREIMIEVYGEPMPLILDTLGEFAELAGETALLENGQDMWSYTYTSQNNNDPGNDTAGNGVLSGKAVVTMKIVDDHAYIAEYLDPAKMTVSETAAPINVEGFDKLGQNEQIAVRLYAEYLEKQYNDALQQYVNYFLDKNKQEDVPSDGTINE